MGDLIFVDDMLSNTFLGEFSQVTDCRLLEFLPWPVLSLSGTLSVNGYLSKHSFNKVQNIHIVN